MQNKNRKVAIVYLSFHCEPYLDDVISGLKNTTYPKDMVEFIVVDNPHPEFGSSLRYLEETIMPLSGKEISHVTLLPQKENLGFAGGNNKGIEWAIEHEYEYVFFHNNDGFMSADCITALVAEMDKDVKIGVAQSLMLLHPETDYINSAGNSFQYLGFGFCNDYKRKYSEAHYPAVLDVSYASGAAVLMRTDLLRQYGVWDTDFFLYHEDLEYSFRLRVAGFRVVMVAGSLFYHKYQFGRSIQKFYWMERNRYGVMLMFFRWPTLVLLLPMMIVLECGLWIFSFRNHWIEERIRVYRYWLKLDNIKLWLKKRAYIQSIRIISDREIMKGAASGIHFQEKMMENPILTYFGNPLMKMYYWIVVRGLVWW